MAEQKVSILNERKDQFKPINRKTIKKLKVNPTTAKQPLKRTYTGNMPK